MKYRQPSRLNPVQQLLILRPAKLRRLLKFASLAPKRSSNLQAAVGKLNTVQIEINPTRIRIKSLFRSDFLFVANMQIPAQLPLLLHESLCIVHGRTWLWFKSVCNFVHLSPSPQHNFSNGRRSSWLERILHHPRCLKKQLLQKLVKRLTKLLLDQQHKISTNIKKRKTRNWEPRTTNSQ